MPHLPVFVYAALKSFPYTAFITQQHKTPPELFQIRIAQKVDTNESDNCPLDSNGKPQKYFSFSYTIVYQYNRILIRSINII